MPRALVIGSDKEFRITKIAALTAENIKEAVHAKLEGYKNLSVLEQYAMFMGKAQILEFGLKGLLSRMYGVPSENMEKWTLGKTKNELRVQGLRPDFIIYLESIVNYRMIWHMNFLLIMQ